MKKILLIGGGGHAKSCIDVIESTKKYKIVGIIDNKLKNGTKVLRYKVIGNDKNLKELIKNTQFAYISVGKIDAEDKRSVIYKKLIKIGFKFPKIISKYAYVSKNVKIGAGTMVHHGVIINSNVQIGKNCIINSRSLIEHDVVIRDNCHISTSATINGNVKIFENTFIGSGSIVKNNLKINKNSFIKMGSILKKWARW